MIHIKNWIHLILDDYLDEKVLSLFMEFLHNVTIHNELGNIGPLILLFFVSDPRLKIFHLFEVSLDIEILLEIHPKLCKSILTSLKWPLTH